MKETHYTPSEYSIALTVFKDLEEEHKRTIDNLLHNAMFGCDKDRKKFEDVLNMNRGAMGDTLYCMYSNIYMNYCNVDKSKQYELFR